LDIDFAWDERDDLIKAVIDKFGSDYCARVANHNMFRYRSALRETAKAYGFGDGEITQIERQLQTANTKDEIKFDQLWKEILRVAAKIEGLPRGLGMHCGGIVLTPEPICRYAPIEKSAEGYPLLAWEKEGTEAAGFVKIDLLGNRSLAVIRDALQNLEQQGITIDRDTWKPLDDKPTIEALARGDSIGVFYSESPAMRQLQKKTNAGDFEHIVIHSSIIRPEVVIGFMAIKGLSVSGVRAIVEEREKNGYFKSLNDFSRRVKLNRDDILTLCPAGVFDSIADDLSRPLQARQLLGANTMQAKNKQTELFAAEPSPISFFVPHEKQLHKSETNMWEEYRALGFLRNLHPLALWKNDVLAVKYRVKALHINKYVGQNVKMVGWSITQKDVWTKDGLTMAFLSLEDETGMYETVVFPEVYDKYYKLLFDQKPLLVYGKVTNDEGAVSLEINKIEVLGKQKTGETASLIGFNGLKSASGL
jgi:DNA polymerase III alpha subunit